MQTPLTRRLIASRKVGGGTIVSIDAKFTFHTQRLSFAHCGSLTLGFIYFVLERFMLDAFVWTDVAIAKCDSQCKQKNKRVLAKNLSAAPTKVLKIIVGETKISHARIFSCSWGAFAHQIEFGGRIFLRRCLVC
jgi:hypothetical protein